MEEDEDKASSLHDHHAKPYPTRKKLKGRTKNSSPDASKTHQGIHDNVEGGRHAAKHSRAHGCGRRATKDNRTFNYNRRKMAPTTRTPLQNASKTFKTIIASPASFIRKRLRREDPKRNLKRVLDPKSKNVCSHRPSGIGQFVADNEARALCDLFTEDASSYADWTGMFLHELEERLAAMTQMWEPAMEVMKAGSGFTRVDLNTLKKFHSRTLASLLEMVGTAKRSNWSKPRVNLSCRYHQDLDEIYFQICHCHEDIRRLVGFIGTYIDKCVRPTVLYGVKCRLDVRIRLRDVDIVFERAVDALQQTRLKFDEQLEPLFRSLRKTSCKISDFLSTVEKPLKKQRGSLD